MILYFVKLKVKLKAHKYNSFIWVTEQMKSLSESDILFRVKNKDITLPDVFHQYCRSEFDYDITILDISEKEKEDILETYLKSSNPRICANFDMVARRIRRLRCYLLFHAITYYEFNDNIISDSTYDVKSIELFELQKQYPELLNHVGYYDEIFKDFNPSTGYNLPLRDPIQYNRVKSILNH